MAKPHYVTQTTTLRRIVSNPKCRFKWCDHALEQMGQRHIIAEDVICALTHGHVVLEEYKQDILWRVSGRDIDGNRLQVLAVVYEETITIKIVTTF